jgi:PAT family beta-lactamase induction signal transducer AmpG
MKRWLDWRMLRMGLLGFSSGLPLLLVFGTLSFWLREADIDRTTIGFISWVALLYGLKVLWSPLVDQMPLPGLTRYLGRRRAWLLLSQLSIISGLIGMALTDPAEHLDLLVWLAVWVAFASATQDIVVDAYRIEMAELRLQGLMSGFYTTGYRLAMFVASAGALGIAAWFDPDEATYQHEPWVMTYLVMAGCMLVGLFTTLCSPEPDVPYQRRDRQGWGAWLHTAIWRPFSDFIQRYAWTALIILVLIASYRISDIVLGVTANVFYKDMGFTKSEIAWVSKGFGIYMVILGALLGGVAVYRVGIMRMLLIGAILAAATNLLFAWLATVGHDFWLLVAVVGMDNLSAGIASAAFIAYLSGLTNVVYSATQYALFSSLMLLLPKFLGGFSGAMVDGMGYEWFFTVTALLGVPVILWILVAWRYTDVELPSRD